MGYRSKEQRHVTILEVAKEGIGKSHLMYRAMLCYEQMVEDVATLLKLDLLQYNTIDKKYHTTQRGRDYLDMRQKFLCAPSVV